MKTEVQLPKESEQPVEELLPIPAEVAKREVVAATCPFVLAEKIEKRLKILVFGDAGAGKTTFAIQFPNSAVCDTEDGTAHYGGGPIKFHVFKTTTFDAVERAVDYLLTHKHSFQTLIIDSISVIWDALQKQWSDTFLRRNKGSKGHRHEYYDMQPKDWLTIKASFKSLIRKLLMLDCHVILTARIKQQFKEGSFMVASGETFDCEKNLAYYFDIVLRMYVDEKGRHLAVCLKDRTNRLPKEPFEPKYALFESLFGKEALSRESRPIVLATEAQKARILELIGIVGMPEEQVAERLEAYGAETLDDLTTENADIILTKLQAAVAAMKTQGGK